MSGSAQGMVGNTSASVGIGIGTAAQSPRPPTTRERLPKRKICTNEDCHRAEWKEPITEYDAKFCPSCGSELSEELADLYIEFHYKPYDEVKEHPSQNDPMELDSLRPKEDNPPRISMREFIKYFKEYEKELFLEEI
jgi:RNA polymerase subunit RPABC4/transcription elongation factor Spt4